MRHRVCFWLIVLGSSVAGQEPPVVKDDALKVSLFAAEPMIQTPIGTVMDAHGRLLVIESHTHFRPKDWKGPEYDQIVWLADDDGDGRADRREVVMSETKATMDIALHPDGWIYLATRNEILRWKDNNDDGRPDHIERRIVYLDTEGSYPHNGLSGLAFDPSGNLWFGMGENLGAAYTLRAGAHEISDQGEGGNIFTCTHDGQRLRRVATGFWNPFGVCVDPWGNVFATDNDPDSRPPCRLQHIVEGGNYGYQFRYGRSGLHPFVSWNGELPGTLPMLAGTGEAPCDVIFYAAQSSTESAGLGARWNGTLLVASWVDHRVESYRLKEKDGSFTQERSLLLEGGVDFRPVAFATAKDGTLFVTDWVKRNYELHGHGRIWKVEAKTPTQAPELQPYPSDDSNKLIERILYGNAPSPDEAVAWLKHPSRYVQHAATHRLAREGLLLRTMAAHAAGDEAVDAGVLVAAREAIWLEGDRMSPVSRSLILRSLAHPSDSVALLALKWIADKRIAAFRTAVEGRLADSTTSPPVYYGALTTLARLDSAEAGENELLKRLKQEMAAPALPFARRRMALEIFPDRDRHLQVTDLVNLLPDTPAEDKPWLVHVIGTMRDVKRLEPLRQLALDEDEAEQVRIAAMAHATFEPSDAKALSTIALGVKRSDAFRRAALQAMQGLKLDTTLEELLKGIDHAGLKPYARRVLGEDFTSRARPPQNDSARWAQHLRSVSGTADPANGRQVFLSPRLGGCAACHRAEALGSAAGPDLSSIGAVSRVSGEQMLESILQPNQNVAPRYESFNIQTADGQTRLAFQLHERGGSHTYIDIGGNTFDVKIDDLVKREPLPVSIMPEGLVSKLTDEEVRDLVAWLQTLGK